MLRRSLLVLVIALVAVACNNASGDTTTSAEPGASTTGEVTTTPPSEPSPTTTTQSATTSTAPDLSGLEGVSEVVRAQLEELIVDAQEVRQLPFLSPPTIVVVSDAELEARVRESIAEESEDFPGDQALYKLLGLLDADTDLENLLLDLYGEQVAGFYDGDSGEIVVPAREDGFSVIQQATLVHELVHALTDQNFDFNVEYQAMIEEDRLDQATAYQALIEGDATFAEVQWVRGLSQQDLGRFVAESLEVDTNALSSAPPFLQDSLFFPYDSGLVFVQDLFSVDGWNTVNEAYIVLPDLPGSTEQVITPGDYQRDLPIEVGVPAIDLAGYNLERTSVWGEQGLRLMLDQTVGGSTAARAADGWGGDGYSQWFDGQNAAFLMVYEADTGEDLAELEDALLDYAIDAVPSEAFVWVDTKDGLLYFIAADVFEVGESLRSSVGLG
ncbi:MAG: hypothetical protein WBM90_00995 [Acidimicrobiia bacterium]